ncbi:tRNA nucleotidyltransferase/poly(A) polymerase [Bradyrhizobium sp. AZCC 1614]
MSEARVLSDAPWLRSGPAARVLALLNGDGEEARVIGGAVRNALLKIPLGDIDIATTALPDEVVRRAKAAGIKCVPTGIDHGTVTLVVESHPFEVTTLREDTETFGRKARVAFGRDWVRDAERRDFTINGLSVDAEGIVHDHVGGLADIQAKRVRFSSATPASASPRIICASCASFACMPPTGRASLTVPDISPASMGVRGFRAFLPNACAWRC